MPRLHIHYSTFSTNSRGYMNTPSSIGLIGGKGGVGTTSIAINLACAFAKSGRKTLLVDADPRRGDIDPILNLSDNQERSRDVGDVTSLGSLIKTAPFNVRVLTSFAGFLKPDHGENPLDDLAGHLKTKERVTGEKFDISVLDLGSKLVAKDLSTATSVERVLLVTTPEPASIVGTYQTIKDLHVHHAERKVSLVVNMVRNQEEAFDTFQAIDRVAGKYLDIDLALIGSVPTDVAVSVSCRTRQTVLETFPSSVFSKSIDEICNTIISMGNFQP